VSHVLWYLTGAARAYGLLPFLRAALICGLLYQINIALVLAMWLARKAGISPQGAVLEPHNRHSAVVVLPTLLSNEGELDGLQRAMRSVARNEYPGPLLVVACIDGRDGRPDLFSRMQAWSRSEKLPANVAFHVVGTPTRMSKAIAMDWGVEHLKQLVAAGRLARFPTLFFNMDADSELGPRALERMAFKLTRKRRLARTPHMIVTSNVLVDPNECVAGVGSLSSGARWLATFVAREYLTSISLGRSNTNLFPVNEASGALYCTWSQIYLRAPRYARFLQSLSWTNWLKWWIGFAPPRFSAFEGAPLVEAMAGPGDDTWMTWLACSAVWKGDRICFDFPRTPLHAFARMLSAYVSRPLSFDALAQVYTKTPTTTRGLFKQRIRWNSSRVNDIKRWFPSLAYHWQIGAPVIASSLLVIAVNAMFVAGLVAPFLAFRHASEAVAVTLLAGTGYMFVRLAGTLVALLVSQCSSSHWRALVSLPLSGCYHVVFNMIPAVLGTTRDLLGFGQPTTFAPEATTRASGLTRIALAYRARRAILLACRAVVFGDVPWGSFWFGWGQTPWTPSGFDGWTTGVRPPPVYWPRRRRSAPPAPPSLPRAASDG